MMINDIYAAKPLRKEGTGARNNWISWKCGRQKYDSCGLHPSRKLRAKRKNFKTEKGGYLSLEDVSCRSRYIPSQEGRERRKPQYGRREKNFLNPGRDVFRMSDKRPVWEASQRRSRKDRNGDVSRRSMMEGTLFWRGGDTRRGSNSETERGALLRNRSFREQLACQPGQQKLETREELARTRTRSNRNSAHEVILSNHQKTTWGVDWVGVPKQMTELRATASAR